MSETGTKTTKLQFPNPLLYGDTTTFFREFLKINGALTHRGIADELLWPSSYVADLVKARKRLTCIRVMEFAHLARYSISQTEHLIFMGLRDHVPERYHGFFADRLDRSKVGSIDSV